MKDRTLLFLGYPICAAVFLLGLAQCAHTAGLIFGVQPIPTTQPAINSPSPYTPAKLKAAAKHKLAKTFIDARKIWADRGTASPTNLCEYQALTGDATYEDRMLELFADIVEGWPLKPDPYKTYVTNPEPYAIELARAAALNPKAREVLRPVLLAMLKQLHDGTHGWNATWGKVSLCRVRIQQALGQPCDPLADYGATRGLTWMLENTWDSGWQKWSTGSPKYQRENCVFAAIGWPVRSKLPANLRKRFDNAIAMAYYWNVNGKAPQVGEDKLKNRIGKPLWPGYAWQYPGTSKLHTYCRWLAQTQTAAPATHFDTLLLPETPDAPPEPGLPAYTSFLPAASIERFEGGAIVHFYPVTGIDTAHKGMTETHEFIAVAKGAN